jgi:hypothetical protein
MHAPAALAGDADVTADQEAWHGRLLRSRPLAGRPLSVLRAPPPVIEDTRLAALAAVKFQFQRVTRTYRVCVCTSSDVNSLMLNINTLTCLFPNMSQVQDFTRAD